MKTHYDAERKHLLQGRSVTVPVSLAVQSPLASRGAGMTSPATERAELDAGRSSSEDAALGCLGVAPWLLL